MGASIDFVATATDQLGATLVEQPTVTWTLPSSPTAGTVTSNGAVGIYTAPNKFTVDVISVAGGGSSNVVQPYSPGASTPASLSVFPIAAQVFAGGGTQQFIANVADARGFLLTQEPVTWSVQPSTLGSCIGPDGVFVAGSTPGPFQVLASAASGGLQGSVTVTVVPYECQYPFCQAVPHGQESSALWICNGGCYAGNCYKRGVVTNQPQFCAANPASASTVPATALYTDLNINAGTPNDSLFLCDDPCLKPGGCSGLGQVTEVQNNCAGLSHKIALSRANRVPTSFAGPAMVSLFTCNGICLNPGQCERNGTLVADPALCVGGATPLTGVQAVK